MPDGGARGEGPRSGVASVRELLLRRWPAGLLALAGLGLAVPTIWLPTFRLVLSDAGRGAVLSEETAWSWGRSVMRGGPERVFGNEQGLVLLGIALLLGLVGALAWLFVPGVVGLLLALAGVAVLTSRLATSAAQRLGRAAEVEVYRPTGLDVRSYPLAGAVLETLSSVVLVIALVVMVLQSVRWVRTPAVSDEPGRDGAGTHDEAEQGARPVGSARVGVAGLVPERAGSPDPRPLGAEAVSFTDMPPDHRPARGRRRGGGGPTVRGRR